MSNAESVSFAASRSSVERKNRVASVEAQLRTTDSSLQAATTWPAPPATWLETFLSPEAVRRKTSVVLPESSLVSGAIVEK